MNSKHTHLLRTHHGSHKTLWFGLLGAIVVIVGSIFLAYAQTQKKEAEKMNPTKPMPAEAELRRQLSKDQYRVTRECGTETPFQNAYWDNHRAGIYVDIITGEPLFSSLDKFDSGTGWPSFTKPIAPGNVVKSGIHPTGWSGLRFEAKQAIRTWGTCSTTVPRQPANVIA